MMLGENARLLLPRSPLDGSDPPPGSAPLVQIGGGSRTPRWVPSRFNVRATSGDGELVLWNSYSGSMSVFPVAQRPAVLELLAAKGFQAEASGLAGYLAERGFLVKEGTDEFRRIQLAFGQEHYRSDALELILLASEDCNFRCVYCYEEFARGTMRPVVRERVKRLVEARLPRLDRLRISWFGGEPLYGWDAIEELAPFFQQAAERQRLDFHSHMTTNGYLLTPEVAGKLLAWGVTDYQVTLDGTPEDHDRHRPTRDGGGTFAVIFANLEALSRRRDDFTVALRVNFDRDNQAALEQFVGQIDSAFHDDPRFALSFHAIGRWGGPQDADLAVCGGDEARRLRETLEDAARRRGLKVGGGLSEIHGPGSQVCYAARPYSFIIGAEGQVMKCTIALDRDAANVVGRLQEDGGLDLDHDKMALWTEPAFEGDAKCRKCVILPTCQGLYCPKIRIEEARSPCPDTRLSAKRQLLDLWTAKRATARRRRASAPPAKRVAAAGPEGRLEGGG